MLSILERENVSRMEQTPSESALFARQTGPVSQEILSLGNFVALIGMLPHARVTSDTSGPPDG